MFGRSYDYISEFSITQVLKLDDFIVKDGEKWD